MIQRIQSVYLLITTLLSSLLFAGKILIFRNAAGSVTVMNLKLIWESTGNGSTDIIRYLVPLSAIIVLIILLSIVAIFFYRRRKIQMKFALVIIILSAALIALLLFVVYSITFKSGLKIIPGIEMSFPILILVFSVLARNGIIKDENLVRSYDRLR
jgi:hypothetical protein